MSLIRLSNGDKFEIDQPQENESGMMMNRQRGTLELTFRALESDFIRIQQAFTPANLEKFNIYYPDNETAHESDEQLEGVAHKEFVGYQLIGDWNNKLVEEQKETRTTAPVYGRKLTVMLGQLLASETQ